MYCDALQCTVLSCNFMSCHVMLYLPNYLSFYLFPIFIFSHFVSWFYVGSILILSYFYLFSNYLWIYNVPSFISWPLSNYHLTSIVAIADSSIPVAAGTGDIFHTFSHFLCFIGSTSNNPFFLVNLNPPLLLVKHKFFFAWSSIDFQIFYEPSEINWHPGSPVVESWLRGRPCGASAAGCPQCSDVWCSRGDGGVGCFLRKRKSAGPEMIWVFFGKAAVWFWEICFGTSCKFSGKLVAWGRSNKNDTFGRHESMHGRKNLKTREFSQRGKRVLPGGWPKLLIPSPIVQALASNTLLGSPRLWQ